MAVAIFKSHWFDIDRKAGPSMNFDNTTGFTFTVTSLGSIRALTISNAITGPAVRYVYICHALMPATMDEFQSNSSFTNPSVPLSPTSVVCDPT